VTTTLLLAFNCIGTTWHKEQDDDKITQHIMNLVFDKDITRGPKTNGAENYFG